MTSKFYNDRRELQEHYEILKQFQVDNLFGFCFLLQISAFCWVCSFAN